LGRAVSFFVTLSGCVYDYEPVQPPAASRPDAAAPMPDASTVARVTVVFGEAPAAGVPVYFHGIAEVMTDSAGHASHEITPDTTVTTAFFDGRVHQLQTVVGIQPGDDVVLGSPVPHHTPPGPSGTIQVSVPPFPGAFRYDIEQGCGGTTIDERTVVINYTPDCLLEGKVYVVARAVDISNQTLAYAGGSFTPPVTSAALEWTSMQPVAVDLLNMPPGAIPSWFEVDPEAGWIFFPSSLGTTGRTPKTAGRLFLAEPPAGVAPDYYITIRLEFPEGTSQMEGRVAAFGRVEFDFRPFVPIPVSPTIEGSTIRWSTTGPMDTVQGVSIQLITGSNHYWTITVPPTTSLVLPGLPDDMASYRPAPVFQGPYVQFFASTRFHSYADIRRKPSAADFRFQWSSPGPYRFFYAGANVVF
jgi:hypothetical protein